jgi:hypothetical protein
MDGSQNPDADMLDLPPLLNLDEYYRLIEAGAFGDLRIELLDARVTPMSPFLA